MERHLINLIAKDWPEFDYGNVVPSITLNMQPGPASLRIQEARLVDCDC